MQSAEMIILWGANVLETRLGTEIPQRLVEAKKRGAQVVVVDPRRSATVEHTATWWLPCRPGTDAALMLAVLHVLLTENLADRAFMDAHAAGFDLLEALRAGPGRRPGPHPTVGRDDLRHLRPGDCAFCPRLCRRETRHAAARLFHSARLRRAGDLPPDGGPAAGYRQLRRARRLDRLAQQPPAHPARRQAARPVRCRTSPNCPSCAGRMRFWKAAPAATRAISTPFITWVPIRSTRAAISAKAWLPWKRSIFRSPTNSS